jgi:hypothetical protein
VIDLGVRSGIGLSPSATIGDALEISNGKAVRRFARLLFNRDAPHATAPFSLYIHRLPSNSKLPQNLHITRDERWDAKEEVPGGHHSLDSTYGDTSGAVYVERLRMIPFDKDWLIKADYRVEKEQEGGWMCLRTIQQVLMENLERYRTGRHR